MIVHNIPIKSCLSSSSKSEILSASFTIYPKKLPIIAPIIDERIGALILIVKGSVSI